MGIDKVQVLFGLFLKEKSVINGINDWVVIPASFLSVYLSFVVFLPDTVHVGLVIAFRKALFKVTWFFTNRTFSFVVLFDLISYDGELERLVLSDDDQWAKQ
jgi:hypothetical protein